MHALLLNRPVFSETVLYRVYLAERLYVFSVVGLIMPSCPKAGRAENACKCAWAR